MKARQRRAKRYTFDEYVMSRVKKRHLKSECEHRNGLVWESVTRINRKKPRGLIKNEAAIISLAAARAALGRPPKTSVS